MRGRRYGLRDFFQIASITAVAFILVELFAVQGLCVHGECMEPNLYNGERLLSVPSYYRWRTPARGEIVVFRYPPDPSKLYVKRVIGLPGETVAMRRGVVYVNGRRLAEGYVARSAHGGYPATRVPPGQYFVLGDNRDHSSDSREWGMVPAADLEGKVWVRFWPMQRAGRPE